VTTGPRLLKSPRGRKVIARWLYTSRIRRGRPDDRYAAATMSVRVHHNNNDNLCVRITNNGRPPRFKRENVTLRQTPGGKKKRKKEENKLMEGDIRLNIYSVQTCIRLFHVSQCIIYYNCVRLYTHARSVYVEFRVSGLLALKHFNFSRVRITYIL